MGAKKLSPKIRAQASAMLAVGYSQTAVADELKISLSSVRRISAAVVSGSDFQLLELEARETLRKALDDDYLKMQVCRQIVDDLSLSRRLRANLAVLLNEIEQMPITDLKTAGAKSRILAQAATSLKLNSDQLRSVVWRDTGIAESELPELLIREMTSEEVTLLRKEQEERYAAMGCK